MNATGIGLVATRRQRTLTDRQARLNQVKHPADTGFLGMFAIAFAPTSQSGHRALKDCFASLAFRVAGSRDDQIDRGRVDSREPVGAAEGLAVVLQDIRVRVMNTSLT